MILQASCASPVSQLATEAVFLASKPPQPLYHSTHSESRASSLYTTPSANTPTTPQNSTSRHPAPLRQLSELDFTTSQVLPSSRSQIILDLAVCLSRCCHCYH